MTGTFECLLCGGRAAVPFLLECADYYLAKAYRASYYRCSNCGLIQQSPLPGDVSPFYDDYPVHRHKATLFEFARRKIMKPCYFDVKQLQRSNGVTPVIVDFGCGDGWYLDSLKNNKVVRIGFELNVDQAIRVSQDIRAPVFSNENDIIHAYGGKVDVVTMHFVMEHITNWHSTFAILRALLKPNGIIFITVPNIASWEFNLFRRKWHNLDPPRHIAFPDRCSIQRIARESNLALAASYAIPFPNGFAGSVSAILTGRFRFGFYLAALPLGLLVSRIFPNGNRAYVLRATPTS